MGADLEKTRLRELTRPTSTNAMTSARTQPARTAINPNLIRDEEVVGSTSTIAGDVPDEVGGSGLGLPT
jgi:hypothetical protein